jgi:hypothetical protein
MVFAPFASAQCRLPSFNPRFLRVLASDYSQRRYGLAYEISPMYRGIPPVARPRGAYGLPLLFHYALCHFRHDCLSGRLILLLDLLDPQPQERIDHCLLTPRGPILDPVEEIQAHMH